MDKYLGHVPDIGSVLTAKLLKPNDEVIYQSTFHQLTPNEIQSPIHQALHTEFDTSIAENLGPAATGYNFF